MFDSGSNVFDDVLTIPPDAQVIFVADMFADEYQGGAELTTQALIDSSPFRVFKLKAKHLTTQLMSKATDRFWVFGNFASMNANLIPTIVANLKYAILEYDYKYCRFRSPEKHEANTKAPCDCHEQMNGKIISAFYYGASHLFWMSEGQKDHYARMFPFLLEKDNTVLSSVFDHRTLAFIKLLREQNREPDRKGWIVLGSSSWIKGADDAKKWCDENGKEADVVWNVPYEKLLSRLALAEGFVYLPKGMDTCPRMVIEAKLLGCQLHLNDNVQHKDEEWFATDDLQAIEEYLYTAPKIFWNSIIAAKDHRYTISGYTTTYNCLRQQYPFKECIASMLQFCDEVCVVDGGSTDGTWEALENFKTTLEVTVGVEISNKLKLKKIPRDWTSKRHPVFDGMQKAEARKMCTKEFCWQMDSDEIVHEDDAPKVQEICKGMSKQADIVSLPVIEYWGGPEKVRMDVPPWKWRLSRNLPHITHGIPKELRAIDEEGNTYSLPGSDGCDMIHAETGERLMHISFYTQEIENIRRAAILGDENARKQYEEWFNKVTNAIPGVFHYSWYDLSRKIKLYRHYWQNHWRQLWNQDSSDTAENNFMFGIPWKDVTDEMIEHRALEMKMKLGGWVWHHPWDGNVTTPHITCNRTQPKVMIK